MELNKKITINMLSSADKIEGQGVGSAYLEQVKLVSEGAPEMFDVRINSIKKADIIHTHTVDPQNYIKMKSSKNAVVCYVHFLPDTLDGSIQLPKIAFSVFKKYVISFYKSADYLIVVNPTFMDELEKYGISRDKMVYIPNYVSKEEFYPKPKEECDVLRKKYEIDPDAFVVIGVGQVQMRKGVLDFIEVAKKLPEVQFVWCGGFSFGKITDGYEELSEVVENPPANVKFTGIVPRSEMNDMYNMSDVLFMPSYNELFPMAILEAVNLHIPLVLRDLDLYRDILFEKYERGDDNDTFAQEIEKLYNDKKSYEECQIRSKEISEFYCKENVLQIWKDFYTKVYEEQEDGVIQAKKRKPKEKKK
ncbi:MAG: glycosyltransferase family 4 protein [Longicatena sp.]